MSHALWQGCASASLKELMMWLTLAVTVPSQKNENKIMQTAYTSAERI